MAALRLRWLAAANLVALGLALAGLFTLFTPVQYRSQVQLYAVAVNRQITSNDLYNSARMAESRLPVYVPVAESPQVLDPVIADLGLAITSAELAERMTVTRQEDTALMEIAVQDARPAGAKALADALAARLVAVARDLEKVGQQPGAVELRLVSESSNPTLPVTPFRALNLLIGLGGGLLTALIVLLLTAVQLHLQRRATRAQWVYLDVDGELRLVLAHLVGSGDAPSPTRPSAIALAVQPFSGATPRAATRHPAEVR